MILFWQFAIKTIQELDVVSNQNLSIEMFLIRLMHLVSLREETETRIDNNSKISIEKNLDKIESESEYKNNDAINQIKNITQEKNSKPEFNVKKDIEAKVSINSFKDLLNICIFHKEIKLKYELENNVNLVKFEKNRIEISFNDDLDKSFVKNLSLKLFEWTGERWIITFSKLRGEISIKDKEKNQKTRIIENEKRSNLYKEVLKNFLTQI